MKRFLLTLFLVVSLIGFSFGKGKRVEKQNFAVEFTFGPAFGFGDVFKEYSETYPPYYTYSIQNKLGIHFGFGARYYVKENISVQGAIDFQNVSTDWKWSSPYLGIKSSGSEGWHINKFFLNGVYDLSTPKNAKLTPYLFAGLGLGNLGGYAFEEYKVESETKFGFNVGAGVRYNLTEDFNLIGYLVFTDIFTEENATTYLGIHLGIEYRFSFVEF
jgi:opacity protein-like surface antigen